MPEHDLIYMVDGTWKIGQENESYELKSGEVLILEAHHHHYGIEPCSMGAKTIFIHAYGLDSDNETGGSLHIPSLINTRSNPHVRHYFEKVVYAKHCSDELAASIYFDTVLCELKNCISSIGKNTVAEQIREYITFAEGIPTNAEIASHLNISLKTAEQAFKNAFNKTIHQYLLEIKIENAKQYLIDFPDMRVYEIAEILGFYDEFHFSKQFKKLTGAAPKEFREINKL